MKDYTNGSGHRSHLDVYPGWFPLSANPTYRARLQHVAGATNQPAPAYYQSTSGGDAPTSWPNRVRHDWLVPLDPDILW